MAAKAGSQRPKRKRRKAEREVNGEEDSGGEHQIDNIDWNRIPEGTAVRIATSQHRHYGVVALDKGGTRKVVHVKEGTVKWENVLECHLLTAPVFEMAELFTEEEMGTLTKELETDLGRKEPLGKLAWMRTIVREAKATITQALQTRYKGYRAGNLRLLIYK